MQKSEFIECVHAENAGQVHLHGELTTMMAMEVSRALANFFGYYCYPSVSLHLHSPGGDFQALQHLIEAIARWRRDGRKIETESTFEAISAAAVLLSLGDVGFRRVGERTTLLFHTSRLLDRERPLTSVDAQRVAGLMDVSDQLMISQMSDHILSGLGGISAMAAEGRARCDLLRHLCLKGSSMSVTTTAPKKGLSQEIRSATRMWSALDSTYRACARRSSVEPLLRFLHTRLIEDKIMHPLEAYALCLIDSIEDFAALPPRAALSAHRIRPMGRELKHKGTESSEGQTTEMFAPPNDSDHTSDVDDWSESSTVTATQTHHENATLRHR